MATEDIGTAMSQPSLSISTNLVSGVSEAKLKDLLGALSGTRSLLILTHDNPDPDGVSAAQAKLLEEKYHLPQISTGDMLREAVAAGTPLGRQAKVAMDAGQLVSDEIVLGIIQERITRPDTRNGFILDGFPRNLQQAEALDSLLAGLGRPLHLALLVSVDVEVSGLPKAQAAALTARSE